MLHSENIPSQDMLRQITCPISQQIFLDPVTVSSGQVYERQMVEQLIADAKKENKVPRCPLTKEPITGYATAYLVRSIVEAYLSKNPDARCDQYELMNSDVAEEKKKTVETERAATINQQIKDDEVLARELQSRLLNEEPGSEGEVSQESERERRSFAAFRAQQERELRLRDLLTNNRATNVEMSAMDKYERDALINEIQKMIHGLGFENRESGDDIPAFMMFSLISDLIGPSSCSIKGPKSTAMHEVLKAAIRSLKELNEDILKNTKQQYAGQYDLVQPWFGGEVSLSHGGYANFAKTMGTIENQSGDLVQKMLVRVEKMLHDLCNKYKNNVAEIQTPLRRFGG